MARKQRKGGRGGVRQGSGRPPKPVEEKQARRVMVNLTEAEHAELLDAADGQPVGGFVRRIVLRYLARRRR